MNWKKKYAYFRNRVFHKTPVDFLPSNIHRKGAKTTRDICGGGDRMTRTDQGTHVVTVTSQNLARKVTAIVTDVTFSCSSLHITLIQHISPPW